MRRVACLLAMTVLIAVCAQPLSAEEQDLERLPWDKAYLSIGYYFVTVASGFRLGADNLGTGIDINVEDFLGLNSTNAALRLDAAYGGDGVMVYVQVGDWLAN